MEEASYAELANLQATHWWYRGRRTVLSSVIATLGLPARPRILEAGCGPGGNLEMLARFGSLSAFEPHGRSRENAINRGVADVRSGTLPDGIPFDGPFDLVCAFDVLEHVEQDRESLVSLGSLLAPQGKLLITVPAYQWLWSHHDERLHHFRRYHREQLRVLLDAAGLRIDKLTYFNAHLFPVIASIRGVQKLLGFQSVAEESTPGPFANSVLEKVFAAEAPMVARTGYPFGVSLLAVSSRP